MLLLELWDFCLFSLLNETENAGGPHRRCTLFHQPLLCPEYTHESLGPRTAHEKGTLGRVPSLKTQKSNICKEMSLGSGSQWCCRGASAAPLQPACPPGAQGITQPEASACQRSLHGTQRLHKVNLTDGQIWPVMLGGLSQRFFFFRRETSKTCGKKHPIAFS